MPATSVLATAATGAAAGAVGTLAMDAFRYADHALENEQEGTFGEWEVATPDSFESVDEPAQVALAATDVVGVELDDDDTATAANAVHWATGTGWGVIHALLPGSGSATAGLITGFAAFATSYGILGATGIRDTITQQEPKEVAKDLAGHLLFGLATAGTYRAINTLIPARMARDLSPADPMAHP